MKYITLIYIWLLKKAIEFYKYSAHREDIEVNIVQSHINDLQLAIQLSCTQLETYLQALPIEKKQQQYEYVKNINLEADVDEIWNTFLNTNLPIFIEHSLSSHHLYNYLYNPYILTLVNHTLYEDYINMANKIIKSYKIMYIGLFLKNIKQQMPIFINMIGEA